MNERKTKKSLIKFKTIIENNNGKIKRMIVSDKFLGLMEKFPELFEVNIIKQEDGLEKFYIFGIETIGSQFIHDNLVLEMYNDEDIIIKI